MTDRAIIERLDWGNEITPQRVLAAWPADRPLAALWSGAAEHLRHQPSPWSRWTILAAVSAEHTIRSARRDASGPDALGMIDDWVSSTRLPDAAAASAETNLPPFVGGWIGALSYDLGREIEPRAASAPFAAPGPDTWPLVTWQRCPSAYAFDHHAQTWFRVGRARTGADPFAHLPDEGDLASRERERGETTDPIDLRINVPLAADRDRFLAGVRRVVEYIHAGDVFQTNLAHQLRGVFSGSTRELARRMFLRAAPWYGGYLEDHTTAGALRAVVSISPELFLSFDPSTRTLTTRPIKGTRPGRTDPGELAASGKDRAELNMIVDLMRNDLGRICEFGTVRVESAHQVEHHGGSSAAELERSGVHHGVATISGRVRQGVTPGDILRAAFPGGSITGAPKVRAMQIIDELEPDPRGPYTGCIGFVSDSGHTAMNIAIRTACISGAAGSTLDAVGNADLRFGVGAGIVADSVPELEWRETLDKARVLLDLAADAAASAPVARSAAVAPETSR